MREKVHESLHGGKLPEQKQHKMLLREWRINLLWRLFVMVVCLTVKLDFYLRNVHSPPSPTMGGI